MRPPVFSPFFILFRAISVKGVIKFIMTENFISEYDSYFFVGIGGVSMSALAKILLQMGKKVGGCDRTDGEYICELKNLGVEIVEERSADLSKYGVVVYTDAISDANCVIAAAKRQGKVIISRGNLLAEVSSVFKKTVAVAGCHGKTTCTAMITHVFADAGAEFSSHVGGSDLTYSNGYLGGYDYFITEACEYKRNFLCLKPDVAVILNSDADHLDCYGTGEEVKKAYYSFAERAKETISLYGDLPKTDGITFGFDDRALYHAKKISSENGRFSFIAYEGDNKLGRVSLSVYGKHNVLNALAAVATARYCGVDFECVQRGLSSFSGVKRRFETIGTYNGARCIADYAHHPNEIKAAIKAARLIGDGNLFVVFQPHTYSRTKTLFKDFVSVLSQVKQLLIYKTFAAREYYDDGGSALTLSYAVKRSRYADCEDDIYYFLRQARSGDTVLFLGAGDIYDIAKHVTGA